MIKTPQLTIRGLDARTKRLLEERAAQRGISMNRLVVDTLRHTAQTETAADRKARMSAFFKKHHISKADVKAVEEALAWSDKADQEKRQREEHEVGL